MLAKRFAEASRYAILPVLLIGLVGLSLLVRGSPFAKSFPYYQTFAHYFAMIVLERVYVWRSQVSQRHIFCRDLISTAVETFVACAIMAALVLPVLHYFPNTFLGRKFL